ncbi:MAG: hypothetical protein RXP30_03615 [Thermoplasmata archaeon]|jgi:hypothetical protein|nr:hypothetical protein [Euryarchaeota archaeon]MVT36208.1 hypothetical protein [Euryarchaeota archaeon]
MMKAHSGHIIFDGKFSWKSLEKIYPDLFKLFVKEARLLPGDMNIPDIVLYENMNDIKKGRKPEGYNREGKLRFYFVENENKEMVIVRDKAVPCEETREVTEKISKFLSEKKIKHRVEFDKLYMIELRRKRR